jgi:hypothetical protein
VRDEEGGQRPSSPAALEDHALDRTRGSFGFIEISFSPRIQRHALAKRESTRKTSVRSVVNLSEVGSRPSPKVIDFVECRREELPPSPGTEPPTS